MNLERVAEGEVVLENKQGRLERIYHQLDSFRKEGKMSLHESQILHGLLRYSCGFFAGKPLQQVCMELLRLGQHRSLQTNGRLVEFCDYAKRFLMDCRPRVLRASGDRRPILIFTDASWEANRGGLGAVVLDMADNRAVIYSGEVAESLKLRWDHVICQLELFAMVSLRWGLKHLLHNRRAIWWADNEAARFALIKGQSGSLLMNQLVREFFHIDGRFPSFGWVERVPSFSNPADAPSRFEPESSKDLCGNAEVCDFIQPEELLSRLMQSTAGR